jgi:serine/threonine protein phosphatase 1
VGDIHGCVHAFDAVLEAIVPRPTDTIVVLGDFIDQGRETREVVDRLLQLERTCRLIPILGNHEEMLLAARETPEARRHWESSGGIATIYSYRFGGSIRDIPEAHLDLVARCRSYHETADHIFVHANVDPDLAMPRQTGYTLRWSVLEPDEARCHRSGKTVICGHSEQHQGEILDLGCIKCIDTACWHYGWLTALEVNSGQLWQASRFGIVRGAATAPMGPIDARIR